MHIELPHSGRGFFAHLHRSADWLPALVPHKAPSQALRRKRFEIFLSLVRAQGKAQVSILDVGGTMDFWRSMGFLTSGHRITILNIHRDTGIPETDLVTSVAGDGRDMHQYPDRSFDIAFSNSVIEHLRTPEDQLRMANEIRRIGVSYFVQTPSFFFPIEPHWACPAFQWLPVPIRALLVMRFDLGGWGKVKTYRDAVHAATRIHLLRAGEFRALFPDGLIVKEKFLGLTKSYIAIRRNGDQAPFPVIPLGNPR